MSKAIWASMDVFNRTYKMDIEHDYITIIKMKLNKKPCDADSCLGESVC